MVVVSPPGYVRELFDEQEAPDYGATSHTPAQPIAMAPQPQPEVQQEEVSSVRNTQPFSPPNKREARWAAFENDASDVLTRDAPSEPVRDATNSIEMQPSTPDLTTSVAPETTTMAEMLADEPPRTDKPTSSMQALPTAPPPKMPKPARVPQNPPLYAPPELYCSRCQRPRPPRAHHCRRCGTCVLRMDHHCPWIGGCVGAQNYRFYVNTVFWTFVLTIFVIVSVAVLFARGVLSHGSGHWSTVIHNWDVDGYLISVLAISFFYFLFTGSLFMIHMELSMLNVTSVEQRAINSDRTYEGVLLKRYYSFHGEGGTLGSGLVGAIRRYRARRALLDEWNLEWGKRTREGNPWWMRSRAELAYATDSDSARRRAANLEKVMGLEGGESVASVVQAPTSTTFGATPLLNMELSIGKPYTWFLPMARAKPTAGIHFPLNPRYSELGAWRPRSEWPDLCQT